MLLMTLFDALATTSVSLGISFSAATLALNFQFFHGGLTHLHVLNPRDQKFWHYSARFTCFPCCLSNLLKKPQEHATWGCPVVCAEQLPVTSEMLLTHWSAAFGSSLGHELASSADVLTLSCDMSPPVRPQPAV